jgi:RNA polymerase sigma-70 factor (ECF subfamily)
MTTEQLIREIKAGSVAAQQCFFRLYSARLLMLCRRYVKSREDAEERMLDGFFKFFKTIDSFEFISDAALFAWLKQIMIHQCLCQLRKKNSFQLVSESEAMDITIEEDALNNLSAAALFSLIVQLPVGYRTVFNLYAVEGLTHKEIAGALGISEGSSKSQLWKARALLQKMIHANENDHAKQQSK